MSATVFAKQNPSPMQTRREPLRNSDMENNPQRQADRRSLSGKFRSLFRKNSSSPTNKNDRRTSPTPIRQRSPSPEPVRTATEAPHLRAPLVSWPFGKKKSKLTATTSETTKRKMNRKTKKTSGPPMEISGPVYGQEYQTGIRGQNFIPRTPEMTHGSVGRTQSSSNYEISTKGFRDYTILDGTRPAHQEIPVDVDAITPPAYSSTHSRSPSLNHRTLPDTSIEHSYYHQNSQPISDIEYIPISKEQLHTVPGRSTMTATQMLVENNPVRSPTVIQTADMMSNSDQSKKTSHSSLNNTELHSRTSSSMDVDIPKLNAPLVPFGSISSAKKSKRTDSQSRYNETYNSLSDSSTIQNESFTPLKPTKSSLNKYPTLSAIIEHHMRPTSVHFEERSSRVTTPSSPPRTQRSPQVTTSSSPSRAQRFDTSTTTLNNHDQRQQWSTIVSNASPSSIHYHDGFIRPLTPPKSPLQPDVTAVRINPDDLRARSTSSRVGHNTSNESPIIYRSSTIIYTRDKSKHADRGEIRTWSARDNPNVNSYNKPSTLIQILPPRIINEYQYQIGRNEEEAEIPYVYEREPYFNDRYSGIDHHHHHPNNSDLTRSCLLDEREKISTQSTRSYQFNDHTQESLNTITSPGENSERALRHYTLKRTNSYDGLGILISADAETRLNHRIRDIETDSPASRVGLRTNDQIIHVNGINVEQTDFNDVLLLIKQGLINNNLQFSVRHESISV